ncbi:hypothetical protein MPSEU_000170000 [Mayamaea pseudoterrestris]|nr:hypothetical protein MPSEU_000170000 [Mayamaea pseudoterrestris]
MNTTTRRKGIFKLRYLIVTTIVIVFVYLHQIENRRLSSQPWAAATDDVQLLQAKGIDINVPEQALTNKVTAEKSRSLELSNSSSYVAPATLSSSIDHLQNFDPSIPALWTCSNEHTDSKRRRRHTKVVFVHVFKTAGSSFRMLFLNYAQKCKFGISIVAHCSELSTASMLNGTDWRNKDNSKCRHKTMDRRGRGVKELVTRNVMDEHVDIAIGHLPLGTQWGSSIAQLVPRRNDDSNDFIQYICFFRSPVEKYVSGVIYSNKQYKSYPATVKATVKRIKTFVTNEVKHGKFRESYSAYLLTPWDKDQKPPTVEERTELIIRNMVQYPTVIGIVEKMDSSLELILHVVDQGNKVASLFQQASGNGVVLNKSRGVSTKEVVAILQADTELYPMLQLYLQYDAAVYEFAMQLHDRQYDWLLQQRQVVATDA